MFVRAYVYICMFSRLFTVYLLKKHVEHASLESYRNAQNLNSICVFVYLRSILFFERTKSLNINCKHLYMNLVRSHHCDSIFHSSHESTRGLTLATSCIDDNDSRMSGGSPRGLLFCGHLNTFTVTVTVTVTVT